MSDRDAAFRAASLLRRPRGSWLISIVLGMLALLCVLAGLALAAPGDLDPSFGIGGIITTEHFYSLGMAVQSDGKIVVSGSDRMARYNPDGTLDATFGSAGIAATTGGGHALVFQPDGKIIVGGNWYLARFNGNGSLDAGFGSSGVITIPFGAACDNAYEKCEVAGLAIDAGGKISVGGRANRGFAVARYTSSGQLDPSFGGDGVVVTEFNHTHFFDEVQAVFIQPDSKIVAVGHAVSSQAGFWPIDFALVRYLSDGSLDSTFGTNGQVTTAINGFVGSAVRQPDGKIIAIGTIVNGVGGLTLVRYNVDGSVDPAFGLNGIAQHSVLDCNIEGAAFQFDGKIVVVDSCFMLARLLPLGELDSTFGQSGIVTGVQHLPYGYAVGLGLQDNTRLVVAGGSWLGGADYASIVARYQLRLLPLSQTVTTLSPDAGQLITYTVTLKNADSFTATQVAITDVIPAELTWADRLHVDPPPISGTLGQPPAIVTNLTLEPYQAITLTLPMTVNLGVAPGTVITHSVVVIADQSPLTSTVVITTAGPPVPQNDLALTGKNLPVVVHVLNNDHDPNNDVLSLLDVGAPLSGTASVLGNSVLYTPTLDLTGTDTFTYTVSDGRFTAIGTVQVVIAEQLFRLYLPVLWPLGPVPAERVMTPEMQFSATEDAQQGVSSLPEQRSSDLQFTSTLTPTAYLPIMCSPPPVIMGRVVQNGVPLVSSTVQLLSIAPWFMHPTTISTTVTDENGYYRFVNVTSTLTTPSGNEQYRTLIHGQLQWYTPPITYTAGTNYTFPLVDTTGVTLIDPSANSTITLPWLFQWDARPGHPMDSYEVAFFWAPWTIGTTGPLGYTSSTVVPLSILQGNQFPYLDWYVRVVTPEGFGMSDMWRVNFSWSEKRSRVMR